MAQVVSVFHKSRSQGHHRAKNYGKGQILTFTASRQIIYQNVVLDLSFPKKLFSGSLAVLRGQEFWKNGEKVNFRSFSKVSKLFIKKMFSNVSNDFAPLRFFKNV